MAAGEGGATRKGDSQTEKETAAEKETMVETMTETETERDGRTHPQRKRDREGAIENRRRRRRCARAQAISGIAFLLGVAVSDVETATALSPLILVPQILFAGFFIESDQIPVWLRWAQWLCVLK
eukprot:4722491-Pleurochrysis_carterae.AAC.3